MTEEIKEYDKNKNLIYIKWPDGLERWREYNENNNIIYIKYSSGSEYWYKYDENNKGISITHQEFKQIERTKLYLNNKKISRFSLMDI